MKLQRFTWPVAPACATVLVLLPWISPWSDWPAPEVLPLLTNVVCLAFLVAVIALSGLTRRALWTAACWGWLIAALVNTLLAWLQYFDLAGALHEWVAETPPNQIFGNVRQRNLYASLCAMGLVVLAWQTGGVASRPTSVSPSRARMRSSALGAATLGLGLALSNSRTGLLELVLLWLALAWWVWRAPKDGRARALGPWVLGSATLAYVLSSWLLPLVSAHQETALTRLFSTEDSCASRRVLWANMWQLVMKKPWLGWGWGRIVEAHFITEYQGPRFCGVVNNAHNLPLHLAVTLGLPVALLVVAAVGVVIYRARPWQATDPAEQLAWAVVALIGLHSLLELPLWTEEFQIAFLLCVWYLYGCRDHGHKALAWLDAPVWGTMKSRLSALALAFGLLLASAQVYDSYDRVRQVFVPPNLRPPEYAKGIGLQSRDIVLFVHEIGFAQLSAELTPQNAQNMLDIALDVMHSRLNPFAIERAIAALTLLGRSEEAYFYETRYKALFPDDFAHWVSSGRK